ncbi:PLD nuclease N-terminal domain-containing protein [Streptomyces sp. NPDC086787]|uniref:PLD nuclease N-terminal domain-containing protein n=1 Tax=Streptomyces sp. NPDC086787 TaxID=3365759 RepID=UPI0037F54385
MHVLATQHTLLAAHSAHANTLIAAAVIVLPILLHATLFVGALISISRSGLGGGMRLVWTVFALVAPFLGSLLWFAFGRCNAARQRRFA